MLGGGEGIFFTSLAPKFVKSIACTPVRDRLRELPPDTVLVVTKQQLKNQHPSL